MSYTSFSLYSNPSAWGIPLMDVDEVLEMDPYKEVTQQGQTAPPSHDYAPDLIELEDHVPVYVLEPEEDPEEDPVDYAPDADNDKDEEEESSKDNDDKEEEHLAPADSTTVASPAVRPVPSAEETEPFETDESAATPPPPHAYHNTLRMSIPSPLLLVPLPLTTSPTYTEAPLGYRAARIRLRAASPPLLLPLTSRRANILEANIPRQKRLLLTAPTPSFLDTVDASIRALERRTMAAIEMVNLRRDHAALRGEVDTLRRYLSSLCTTHEQERVEARQALARSEAHNRVLEARITLLETQAHCHEWQCQDTDDRAIGHIMRIQKMPLRKGTKTKTTPATAIATATTPMTDAAIRALIAQGVADALAERTIQRNTNLNGDGR
ncbi:hypothetical protein Tco_0137995 [Tanacetum coccineum]